MQLDKEKETYEKDVIDIDEVEGTDIKINPDYYIHKALLKAQDALAKDNIKEGYMQYRQFIEYIEVIAQAADLLTFEYENEIIKYKDTQDYKEINDPLVKSVKLANLKLKLLMKEVFSTKTATFNLKL